MIDLIVNDQRISARPAQTVLGACLENGIYIPNLCFLGHDQRPSASCRLCFVEIEGMEAPVPACTEVVSSGMKIKTDTSAVRQLQRSALKLLLSVHDIDCKHCHANHACALQDIAVFLKVGLKSKPLERLHRDATVDQSHPVIDHYPHRCVLCGKCISVCRAHDHQPEFTFSERGIDTVIRYFPTGEEASADCTECSRCVEICPVGALAVREPQ